MKLHTQIPLEPVFHKFGYEDKLLLLGSCFSKNIGSKLEYYKFQSVTNPFGILFHPLAIETIIEAAVLDKTFTEEDVFELNGVWKSFAAHSDLNALSRLQSVINLQEAQQELREQLQSSSHLFITLGTAWVYRYNTTDQVVANCHKVPQKEFSKELLSVDEVTQSLSKILTLVKAINSKINITFTVSPVRHIKDGFVENTRSKSHLVAAIHQVVDEESTHYFPAYEIMMDELRDYRFYTNDMLHPSAVAVDYIWEKFVEVYITTKAQDVSKKIEIIQRGLSHRPFNPESEEHQKFLTNLRFKITALQKEYPAIQF